MATTATLSRNEALHNAVLALAGADTDFASERNGVGFSGQDTKFGHRVAGMTPDGWTEELAVEVWTTLRKYRNQLMNHGIDFEALERPEGERDTATARQQARTADRKKRNAPYAVLAGGQVRVYNSFDIKDALKASNASYGFSGWDKAWTADLSRNAAAVLVELGVELRDGADEIRAAAAEPVVVEPDGTVMYDRVNGLIVIKTRNRDIIPLEEVRALPGRQWDFVNGINTCFPVPEVLEIALRYGLEVSQPARDAIEEHAARLAESSKTETDFRTGTSLDDVLREYQLAGVEYMVGNLGSVNADDMGLGKTLQTIAAHEYLGEFPVLVTCPAALRGNWVREWGKWAPWRTIAISDGHTIPDTDVVVVSYQGMASLVKESS